MIALLLSWLLLSGGSPTLPQVMKFDDKKVRDGYKKAHAK